MIIGAGVPVVAMVSAAVVIAAPDDQAGDQATAAPSAPPSTSTSAQPSTAAAAEPSAPPRDQAVVVKQFLRKLEANELRYSTPETLIRDGIDCCQKAGAGMSGPQIAEYIARTRNLDEGDSNEFVFDAVMYLCPQQRDGLTGR